MSKRKSTSTLIKNTSLKSPKKVKISPKANFYSEETQFLQKNLERTASENELTISFALNSEILQKYHEENKNPHFETRLSNEQVLINDILNKIPLKTQYEEILQNDVDFLLPRKYKLLLNKFDALNKALILNKKMKADFRDLQFQLQNEGFSIGFKDLAQLLYINDNFFALTIKNRKLFIEINEKIDEKNELDNFLTEKTQSLRDYFIRILKLYHFDFLKSRGEEQDYLLYESQKVWHPEFQIDRMPEIPQKDLTEFYSDGKFFRVPSKGKIKLERKDEENERDFTKNKLSLLEKISEKVKGKCETFERNKEKIKRNFKFEINIMKTIAKMIDDYFKLRNVSSMFLINVIKHLSQNSSFLSLKEKEVQLYIDELVSIYPEWIHFIHYELSPILQINKSIPLQKIYKELEAFF